MQFSTYILDEAIETRKKKEEEERLKLIEYLNKALHRLSKEISFREAYIFGSITKPYCFIRDSDIDIGFIELEDKDFFKTMTFLSRLIDRDVDIVQLEDHRMEEKIKNEGIIWKRES